MSNTWKPITLRESIKKHRDARCHKCGEKLNIGEEVYRHKITEKSTKFGKARSTTTYYHKKCYEGLWI